MKKDNFKYVFLTVWIPIHVKSKTKKNKKKKNKKKKYQKTHKNRCSQNVDSGAKMFVFSIQRTRFWYFPLQNIQKNKNGENVKKIKLLYYRMLFE